MWKGGEGGLASKQGATDKAVVQSIGGKQQENLVQQHVQQRSQG